MSNNLDLSQVTAGQTSKEVTINAQAAEIDAAMTEFLVSDYTAGNITLTDAQYRSAHTFRTINLSVPRDLTLPALKREVVVDNTDGTDTLSVKVGATTVNVGTTVVTSLYTDGTVNGLIQVGGGGGAGTQDIQEAGSSVVADAIASNYATADFDITDEGSQVAGIALVPARMELGGFVGGVPTTNAIIFRHLATEAIDFAADLAGAVAHLGTVTDAETDLDVQVNGVSKATIRFAIATAAATFPTASAFSLVASDRLDVVTPADMNLGADLSFTLVATKG